MPLDTDLKAFATGKNFAAFTTLLPGGQPMTHMMWVDADDDHILLNTETHRQKYKNVVKDPRVTVTVIDRDDPYRFAEVRGRVVGTVTGPEARAHIDAEARRYTGADYAAPVESERVILRVAPSRVLKRF